MADAPVKMQSERRRLRLITLGGCNVLEMGIALNAIWHHTHVWNTTWPSLGSKPFTLVRQPEGPEFAHLQDFLKRETEKTFDTILSNTKPDVVLLTIGQNVLNDYVLLNDRIIPDFTTSLYLPPERLQGRPRPKLDDYVEPGYRIVTLDMPEYTQVLKRGFRRTYRRLLRPLIDSGVNVLLHAHTLATQALTPDGLVDEVDEITRRRMAVIAEIAAYAGTYRGIGFVEQIPGLNFTSDDAPNGRWAFHPIRDQYAMQAYGIAKRFDPDQAESVLIRFLVENRQRQLRLREDLANANHKLRLAVERRHEAEIERQSLERAVSTLQRSVSWRVTAPLRAVRRRWPGGTGKAG